MADADAKDTEKKEAVIAEESSATEEKAKAAPAEEKKEDSAAAPEGEKKEAAADSSDKKEESAKPPAKSQSPNAAEKPEAAAKESAKPEESRPSNAPKGKHAARAANSRGGKKRGQRGRGGNRRSDSPREEKEFEETILQVDRVSRMMKGGRRMSFRVSVVLGDRKNRVGFGTGKGVEIQLAAQKAARAARKNLVTLPLSESGSFAHRISHKFKAAKIFLAPASEGTGVIAGGAIRTILELGGVRDCLSKNIGTSNRLVVAQATIDALRRLRSPHQKKEKSRS